MEEKKSGCEYFPEITNCVECEYYREVETDYDIVTKCEMYDIELAKKRKKTFAEEALDMLSTHPGSSLSIFFSDWGGLEIQMREYSKKKGPIGANEIITSDLFASKLTIDELMVYAIRHLRKELDKYGCES